MRDYSYLQDMNERSLAQQAAVRRATAMNRRQAHGARSGHAAALGQFHQALLVRMASHRLVPHFPTPPATAGATPTCRRRLASAWNRLALTVPTVEPRMRATSSWLRSW